MAYKGALQVDDETLFKAMEVAAGSGALVMVHAENGDAIDVLVKKALAAGHTEPHWHALTRPPETEGEATNRAIQLAHVAGCPLYVVHVSCKESVEPIALARDKGWNVWGETCTQYFFVDYTFLARPNFEGAKFVYTPPPRDKANQDVLWDAVRTNVLSAISTDHCAFRWDTQKSLGRDDFSKIPNGGPGLENRLQMIHQFGVRNGRITLNRMVELLCTSPAKLFGLYPRKGTLAVGFSRFLEQPRVTHVLREAVETEEREGKADPYDTHPSLRERLAALARRSGPPPLARPGDDGRAIALLDALPEVEKELVALRTAAGDKTGGLKPLQWEEVGGAVHVPLWEEFLRENGSVLAGVTPANLPTLDWETLGRTLIKRLGLGEGEPESPPPLPAAGFAVGAALGVALAQRGFAIEAPPGAPVALVRASRRIEPFELRERLAKDAEGWRTICAEIGFADLDLAAPTGGRGAGRPSA